MRIIKRALQYNMALSAVSASVPRAIPSSSPPPQWEISNTLLSTAAATPPGTTIGHQNTMPLMLLSMVQVHLLIGDARCNSYLADTNVCLRPSWLTPPFW